jgi:hypothetical protein
MHTKYYSTMEVMTSKILKNNFEKTDDMGIVSGVLSI